MKNQGWYAVCFAWLAVACTGTSQSTMEGLCSIDVAGAMESPAELKLSELGSDVRYVPLETTDSCLIGRNPSILLLDKHLVVFSNKECLLFDKENGKFLCKIGHTGDDPAAYSYADPTYNDVDGMLYFEREPNELQKYDLQGNYRGKMTIPTPPTDPDEFVFTDSLIIGHYNGVAQSYNARSLLFFSESGGQVDTVPSLLPVLPERKVDDIAGISVKKQGLAGFILTKFADGSSSAGISGIPFLWKSDGKVRFKESFVDTVYTVEREKLVPYIAFATGKWHWGAEARTDSKNNEERLLMTAVLETDNNIFFQCIRGIYLDEPETFNGIYDRKKGTTRMYMAKDKIVDDITGFMSFSPQTCSAQGEYGNIVDAGDALAWLEEHPEMGANDKLAALKKLTEDSNPVVVITVPW